MILEQFYLGCLAHASYVVGDERSGTAAVVDPRRDVDEYLDFAARHGLRLEHVILTHFHADFVAGHLELRDRVGARIYLGAAAKADYEFTPLGDGDTVDLGRVRLEALETPGHTAESISILVYDRDASEEVPHAVLTGDTLFVGDVGRPDLRVALGWSAESLGGMLYDSVHGKLLALPDSTLVYPAHGAGSLCGKALSTETVSTIGDQRRDNYALQPMTKEAFIKLVTADQPDAPPYFSYNAVLNTRERQTLEEALASSLTPLSLDQALQLESRGAQLLDTRDAADFAAAHLRGSVNIGLDGQFATWAGTVLDKDRPIVIIADPAREQEAGVRLGRIGFDRIAGYLDGGLLALAGRPELTRTVEKLSPAVAARRLSDDTTIQFIDLRSPQERQETHIEGSENIPLSQLLDRLEDLETDRPVLVHCAGGYRSSTAASLLQAREFGQVSEMAGGLTAWTSAGLPTVD